MARTPSTVTSREVAVLAGVSQSAVSRAFTPNSSLSPEKRERILTAAKTLNYVPNSIASSLTTNRTNTVALIVGDTDNPFYIHVLRTFITALQTEGLQALTFTVEAGTTTDDAIMAVLRYRVDGIILTAAQVSSRMMHLCEDRNIPIILFNRYIPGRDANVVRCDNVGGGRLMADAFLKAGAKRFCLLKGDPMGTTSQDRIKGFCERLNESGIPTRDILQIEGNSIYDDAFDAVIDTFKTQKVTLPDAIFGVNDIMAMAAIDALSHRLGKRVPDDVMVGGFDDIPEGRRPPYQLTSVHQPINQMVDETIRILKDGIRKDSDQTDRAPVHIQIPSHLVWRRTISGDRPKML
jgi:DNA-binding LacI/PurR family transcriptional regulator